MMLKKKYEEYEVFVAKKLLSAANKLDEPFNIRDEDAGLDLEKIRALKVIYCHLGPDYTNQSEWFNANPIPDSVNVLLPVGYYFQNGRYLAACGRAAEAKKNLATYLEKAGKEGEFYDAALKLYTHVEMNEKRWARFKINGDGTVSDTQTGLMWKAYPIFGDKNWYSAKKACHGYRGGGHTDWRMPTLDELFGLYNKNSRRLYKLITPMIRITKVVWSVKTRDPDEAAYFDFLGGRPGWTGKLGAREEDFFNDPSTPEYALDCIGAVDGAEALPVRREKKKKMGVFLLNLLKRIRTNRKSI